MTQELPVGYIGYSSNDVYWADSDICPPGTDNQICTQNKNTYNHLLQAQVDLTGAKQLYEDSVMLYQREIIFVVNLLIGIFALIYYIYVNRDVLPDVTNIQMPKMPDLPPIPAIAVPVSK